MMDVLPPLKDVDLANLNLCILSGTLMGMADHLSQVSVHALYNTLYFRSMSVADRQRQAKQ